MLQHIDNLSVLHDFTKRTRSLSSRHFVFPAQCFISSEKLNLKQNSLLRWALQHHASLAPTFPKQCGGWLLRVQPDGSSSLPSLLRLLKSQDQSPSNNRATWLDLQRWALISAPSHVSMELECHQSHERYPEQELHGAALLPALPGDEI